MKKWVTSLPTVILASGISLRLLEYLYNRSLWLDEAYLSLNLINRSFSQLLEPLDYGQHAPFGFLWLERLAVLVFGSGEYSLRLFPLVISLISLFLFYKVAGYFLDKKATLISLFFFATSDALIYYSVEIKQYTFDIFACLLLYFLFFKKNIRVLALVGIIIPWFSHPSIFILASLGLALIIPFTKKRLIIPVLWFVSFITSYILSTKSAAESAAILDFWRDFFAPFPINSTNDLYWYFKSVVNFIYGPLYLSIPFIVILLFLIGSYSIYKKGKKKLLVLTLPILFALFASGLHKYPFVSRFLLFFVPASLILISAGIEKQINWCKKMLGQHLSIGLGLTVLVILTYPSLHSDFIHLTSDRGGEEVKPILRYFSDKRQSDDVLYVYYALIPAFQFYEAKYSLVGTHYILGVSSRDKLSGYIIDLNQLKKYKRVWVMFSHIIPIPSKTESEEQFFVDYLNSIGKRLDLFRARGASIYLYQMNDK